MKKLPLIIRSTFVLLISLSLFNCSSDSPVADTPQEPQPTGMSKVYPLSAVANPSISGTATVLELDDNSIRVDIDLQNTPSGGSHPAHIHFNTAAEGGDIAISLEPINGDTGKSSTTFTTLDDGTAISYSQILEFDGYINVHLSASDLGTLVAQGDIGQNELTGNSKAYTLNSVAVPEIDGSATFYERVNGEALAVIALQNTPTGGEHPAHIHLNTAAEGGGIAFTFNPINGDTGMSKTNVAQLDDNTPFGYADIMDFDGYINVHLSASDLGTIVAQGDIGQNELTGNNKAYTLNSVAVPEIDGSATFYERVNGEALAVIALQNTPAGGEHPAHIHLNTAAEGGGIAFTFNSINGDTGMSKTNVAQLDDNTPFGYADIMDFDGYINVHLSASDLGTIVAQGDIGQNELTGNSKVYTLNTVDVAGISGTATFEERINGTTLITLALEGTPNGGSHPAHIHENDAATGGGIIATLNSVDGTTGMSKTQISVLNDGTTVSYTDLLSINGYINVHLSASDLATIVAQGNIGSNEGSSAQATNYNVTNSGSTAYIFNDSGFNNDSNPTLTLERGKTYTFTVNAAGHPFYINSTQGTGTTNAYNDGVSNNGAASGTITFTVPAGAPDTLYYNCEFHAAMTGVINIIN
ncbi:hypothetical protein [Gaetbulibacter aestuarii]|uniref:CHRD domain-containing protein n=1 Tax=Gaetbulibacter aestuarii TaxID=1502358 RepID=A0ABW7MWI1_9FLAO